MKNNIPFDAPEDNTKDMTLEEARKLLNECGTNINSQQESKVLELINEALDKLEQMEEALKGFNIEFTLEAKND